MPKVLHFEDNPAFAAYFDDALRLASFSVVHCAVPPNDVVGLVTQEKPDILITDVVMPRVDGFTLTTLLKSDERTRHIPVVILTSLSSAEHRARGKIAGANSYVVKSELDITDFINELFTLL
ncbi:MAG: response regulator, partial [Patescibacteria group bacterium]